MKLVTCIAPVNIAVIKYWGKRDEVLILPVNDSISSTLSTDHMCAKTSVMVSSSFEENKFWLNHKEVPFESERLTNCLSEVKKRASPKCGEMLHWKLHICSENNFPTAAGLASSAAGYACLVYALANLYQVEGDISAIARRGSGSACRSIYGGWVRWYKGLSPTGEDSLAVQVAPASHWPQMRIVVLVVCDEQKKTGSTVGMRRSVETSEFLQLRAEKIVPKRAEEMVQAIKNRDFEAFAQLTMQDSNQFHSVALETYPPCFYMNDVSRAIVELVHSYNAYKGANKVAYTYDAGPNACLYLLEDDVEEVINLINETFPPSNANLTEYFRGYPVSITNSKNLREELNLKKQNPGCLKYIIHTKVGDGPSVLTDPSEHLLAEGGLPK